MEPEDVVHVLRRLREALVPDGIVLDLQVIRPNPVVEQGGRALCEIDGGSLLAKADAARAAVDLLISEGMLEEEAVDDHDVRKHYDNGAELVADFADKKRQLPNHGVPRLRALVQPSVVRERCRLRRLQVR